MWGLHVDHRSSGVGHICVGHICSWAFVNNVKCMYDRVPGQTVFCSEFILRHIC